MKPRTPLREIVVYPDNSLCVDGRSTPRECVDLAAYGIDGTERDEDSVKYVGRVRVVAFANRPKHWRKTMKCRDCGAPLKWITTRRKRNVPCEAKQYVRDGSAALPVGKYFDTHGNIYDQNDVPCKVPVWRSHWADCPGADKFRRSR